MQLRICATSVPSERVFSLGGHLVSQKQYDILGQKLKWLDDA